MRRFGVALLACAIVCAGCSDSAEPIRKTMRDVLLQLDDFPPSWRSFPARDDQGDLLGELARCTGVTVHGSPIATEHSGEFRRDDQRITSTAVGFESNGETADRAHALDSDRASECMGDAVRDRVLEAVPGGSIRNADFTVQSGGVNVAVNLVGTATGVVTVDADGTTTQVYIDTVFLYGRNFYCDVTFLGVGKRVSDLIRGVLTDDVALRAQHT
jgi:hypothetical protein